MLEQLLQFIPVAKYILIALGAIGVLILGAGVYKHDRRLVARGGYMLVMAIVIWVCAQLLHSATIDRANQRIYDSYNQY